MYHIFLLSIFATFPVSLYTTITLQPIGLESCSNPLKMQKVFQVQFKKLESFGFCFFVGEIIMGVGLCILAEVIGPSPPTARAIF